ncbi:MAG: HAMP domain-containing histidine kinase [Firmicutes bacterium]|nr:HAMP domain-containing histidine kinase [Bacillota bacterium]
MLKKLRIKIVAAAMVSFAAVMAVILLTAMIISYTSILKEADDTLALIIEGGGVYMPGISGDYSRPDSNTDGSEEPESGDSTDGKSAGAVSLDLSDGEKSPSKPEGHTKPDDEAERPYELRYFSVSLDSGGEVLSHNIKRIAAVDGDIADEYAASVYESGRIRGFIYDYRFAVADDDDGGYLIAFLDCGSSLESFWSNFITTALVMLLAFVGGFVLIFIFSSRIAKPIADSYEKQKQFITDAGHEIKTPITIIEADADVLEMDVGESEWLEDIHIQTKRLKDLTNELIYLSRMEEGSGIRAEMLEFPLSDVVLETAESFNSVAIHEGKELIINVMPGISYTGDEKSLRELVNVLLDNAVKYSSDGGRIVLDLKRCGAHGVVLTVYNTADHVDRDNLDRLFERFYRADASRNSKTGGHGIGLSVAKAVVSAHKGKICASTEDEKSILFTVTLP